MKMSVLFSLIFIVHIFAFGQSQIFVFNGFESDPFWQETQVDPTVDVETKAIISYVSARKKSGSAGMRVNWGAAHNESWGGGAYLSHYNLDTLGVYDFSGYDSIAFWYYVEEPSSMPEAVHLRFNLGDVSDAENGKNTYNFGETEYWYSFHYILDDSAGWNRIALPLADVRDDPNGNGFENLGWYGIEGNDVFDLDMIKGFQFEFSISAEEDDVALGTIVFDNMILISADGDSVIFLDFDGDQYWTGNQVDIEEDVETKAIVSYITDQAKSGKAAMRINWGATHTDSWGGGSYLPHYHLDTMGVYDFSGYDSISFWYYNEVPSSLTDFVHMRINLGDVSDSENGKNTYDFGEMEYWYSFHYILDDEPGWNRVAMPLIDIRDDPNDKGFENLGWYGIEGNDLFDLDMIKGFQIEFSISRAEGDVAQGTIILDDLVFYSGEYIGIKERHLNGPTIFKLTQNYPNPFNASTIINYSVLKDSHVQIKLYDGLWREIRTLVNQKLPVGDYRTYLDAVDLPSGVYYYQIQADQLRQTQKMILIK